MTPTPDPALVERVKKAVSAQSCFAPTAVVELTVTETIAALRAAGWREAMEPLPEDVEAFFDKLTGSVIDAYTLASNDDDERRDAVNRCLRRLVLADRQRAVEAEREACAQRVWAAIAVDAWDQNALNDVLDAIRARTRSAEKDGDNG